MKSCGGDHGSPFDSTLPVNIAEILPTRLPPDNCLNRHIIRSESCISPDSLVISTAVSMFTRSSTICTVFCIFPARTISNTVHCTFTEGFFIRNRLSLIKRNQILEMPDAYDPHPLHRPSFSQIGSGNNTRMAPQISCTDDTRQHTRDSLHTAVQMKLADDHHFSKCLRTDAAEGFQNRDCDRQIKSGSLLSHASRRQVHRNPLGRNRHAEVPYRGAHTFLCLLYL